MSYTLSFKPAIDLYGQHDPSAALFADGELRFAIEEERLTREKHAVDTFPERAIRACLEYEGIELGDVETIVLPYDPKLRSKIVGHYLKNTAQLDSHLRKVTHLQNVVTDQLKGRLMPTRTVESRLREIGTPVPPIENRSHHACHAVSAFHPSPFDEALVLTIDAKGEYDSTVVWHADADGLERVRTYKHPNSWGLFYAAITRYLGYRMFNGEGKVMGLAPYGEDNPWIERRLRETIDVGVDYDVTSLTGRWGTEHGIHTLEELFDRPRSTSTDEFDQFETDLAYTAQKLLEESITAIVDEYVDRVGTGNVALAGGVALNCKLNKRIAEQPGVGDVFVQPVAHDAGLALGGGWIDRRPSAVEPMTDVYWGPEYETDEIRSLLETNKVEYAEPDDLERRVAELIADGALVGWFQGRMELGPRALGNRSILADPRTEASRDRVNRHVKHREEWRPFAPSMLESAADDYLENARPSPFMIDSFDVKPERRDELSAVVHPADDTTRVQTVRADQNTRYYRLLREFGELTGVPVLLNTSFNDHAEPIVNTPTEALKDFYGMGLDVLVLEDCVVTKRNSEYTVS
ncbi:carbamoyltransferase C-terminal domain-containing protein [Natronolimnohabitans sp. A-GB9]|uniref:carbamoyltransferase family protein n=1 Tax=Natronolimnohabitans sp. A-GB9 TaxID=3069757 RepID=UPI0027B16EAD|nr:carbamoyltransferase C-terminal domain-containing protein [Natronolimnohabitans sp. A-GB9]MDQ2049776.1 carbamoyltransferase C-terminal domain-containing protein [Natronolimnohabitans sp. A-GB9]